VGRGPCRGLLVAVFAEEREGVWHAAPAQKDCSDGYHNKARVEQAGVRRAARGPGSPVPTTARPAVHPPWYRSGSRPSARPMTAARSAYASSISWL
jgi:hypothetical protein